MEKNSNLVVGSKIELEIEDIAFGGEGVGRCNDFVIFVPFTIPGEKVSVEIVEVKKNFARACLLEILKPSSHRVEHLCEYFGDCGGCQYQHIDYPYQLEIKRKQIIDLLERVGGFLSPQVDEVAACPRSYQYRNKIMVRSQWNKLLGKLVIGFLRYDNRLVADIQECKIAEPAINEQLEKVRQNPPPRGGLKVMLRILPSEWEVPFDSFFQNNFYALPMLVEKAADCIKSSNAKNLIDAYCGIGFFGISLAKYVQRVIGFDIDLQAIKAAKKNVEAKGLKNCEFYPGKAEDLLPNLFNNLENTALLMDPPRTGVPSESLKTLRQNRPKQIIYVSCHPATFARDLKILCEGGAFELKRVSPVDMFPQTKHVECVADLRRL